jgi:hypothetical protein
VRAQLVQRVQLGRQMQEQVPALARAQVPVQQRMK